MTKWISTSIRNQPFWVDLALVASVVIHTLLTWSSLVPNVWVAIQNASDQATVRSLYLGLLGPAATVAGFAGVVVVFGLTASSSRFSAFRANAGRSLTRTWMASTLAGFEAVGLCIVATLCSLSDQAVAAPWFFELALLLLAHGFIRLLWILSQMIEIVRADDTVRTDDEERDSNVYDLSSLPPRTGTR